MSGRPRHPSAPRSHRHTPRELGPGARPSSSSSPRSRSPEPAEARCSPCRSRSATGSKVGAAVPTLSRAPAHTRCPPPATCAHGAVGGVCRAREAGASRGRAARGDPRFPGRLFVSSRRESVRFAQSPAGEEAGRDQPGKRAPPPSLFQPRRLRGQLASRP